VKNFIPVSDVLFEKQKSKSHVKIKYKMEGTGGCRAWQAVKS
jgi:hypothetical protein